MASGNTLCVFTPAANQPPASSFAPLDTRNSHLVLSFVAGSDTTAIFAGTLPRNYAGGGLTATICWMGATATSGNTFWETSFERDDTGTDLDSDSFGTAKTAAGAASGTSGAPTYTAISHSDGAEIDSLAVGERFRLKVRRKGTSGSDTMTGAAQLLNVEIKET